MLYCNKFIAMLVGNDTDIIQSCPTVRSADKGMLHASAGYLAPKLLQPEPDQRLRQHIHQPIMRGIKFDQRRAQTP
jgi:hypothetical protein